MLASLRVVDWVVEFSEDTPERLISYLLPDVLVKGGDYQVGEVAGAKQVMANGGQVEILNAGIETGCTTTSIVERIRET
jgi:D-beta-D-heptose 7-phosphate kinase/D-beta-D-heptose 1-phosphate adenosyltransferase